MSRQRSSTAACSDGGFLGAITKEAVIQSRLRRKCIWTSFTVLAAMPAQFLIS